jgi:hypothetical protein
MLWPRFKITVCDLEWIKVLGEGKWVLALSLEGGLDGLPMRVSTDGDARCVRLAGRARSRDGLSRLSG